MTERRQVRVVEHFFDQLDDLLPDERTSTGRPSATDFLLYEMPRVIERLALDYDGVTLPAEGGKDLRVLITTGMLIRHIAVYATVAVDGAVDIVGWHGCYGTQCRLELFEWVGPRDHRGDEPFGRSGQRAPAKAREQSSPHHARLAGARRSDSRNESSGCAWLVQLGDEPVDQTIPPEEVVGVGLLEGTQALVRIRSIADEG